MIQTIDLCKIYRTEMVKTHALQNINLEVGECEFVSIMGPSGSGKSTLLNIFGLLDRHSSGEYVFLGEKTSRLSERERATLRKHNIGFVFQSFGLIEELSVTENIELPLLYQHVRSAERKSRVHRVMSQLDLEARRDHYPHQLSGGQQQRVAVGRAIVTEPKLILADEPTGNLDSRHGHDVMRLLSDLNAVGTTVVNVTHSEDYAKYAERVVHLFDGHIVTENMLADDGRPGA